MEAAPPGTVPPVRKSLSPGWSETWQALVPRCHGNMNRWTDGQVMTILGGQLGPGKGSDGLQFAPRGDVVLLGSRLDLEKLLSRQAVDRGPCARRHPSSPGCWTVMTHRDCRPTVCLLESAIQGPHRWTMIPLSSSERAMGVVLGKGFPGDGEEAWCARK